MIPNQPLRDTKVIQAEMHDYELLRRIVWDSLCHSGVTANYFPCVTNNPDLYNDPNCQWNGPIHIDVGFEEHPKVKVLKDYGWYSEDEEIRPMLVYLPVCYYDSQGNRQMFPMKTNSLIQIHYFGRIKPAEFRITAYQMDSVYGLYYIGKLAPERIALIETELKDGSYYLRRETDQTKILDTECEHSGIGKEGEEYIPCPNSIVETLLAKEENSTPNGDSYTDTAPTQGDSYSSFIMGQSEQVDTSEQMYNTDSRKSWEQ